MVEENTKYIAEAWIDNEQEEAFKKSFLQNLIDQLQHHKTDGENAGFDADTVDGMHYCQIVDVFDDKIQDFMGSFSIGKVLFSQDRENKDYYIGFEGVKLYIEDEEYENDYKKLPWINNNEIIDSNYVNGIPNLKQVFDSLYVSLQDDILRLENLIDTNTSAISDFESITERIDSDGKFNADSVNGIRFFIMHETDYAELDSTYKNDPRNVFIIRDDQTPLPQDVLDAQQYTLPIGEGYYQFQVNTDTKKLQFRHNYEEENVWHDLALLSDFYDEDYFYQLIAQLLGGEQSYLLNPESVAGALEQIEISDIDNWEKYFPDPKETFPVGAFVGNKNNNPTLMRSEFIDSGTGNELFINLNDLGIANIVSDLNSLTTQINNPTTGLTALNNNLSSLKNGSTSTISKLDESIQSLNANIVTLNTKLNNIAGNWKHSKYGDSDLWYNPDLKLAYYQLDITVNYNKNNINSWVDTKKTLPYKPKAALRVVSSPYTIVSFGYDGAIKYRTSYDKSASNFNLFAAALYPYQ